MGALVDGLPVQAQRDDPREVLDFWFGDSCADHHRLWFGKDPEVDAEIRSRFQGTWERAARGELHEWCDIQRACLALIVVLDQFPRNMFRGTPRAFATDALARATVRHALAKGFDRELPPIQRMFLYLPFEHSENLADQVASVALFTSLAREQGLDDVLRWARRHRDVVARYGRFPHRNAILGRPSTPEEIEFLRQPGSRF